MARSDSCIGFLIRSGVRVGINRKKLIELNEKEYKENYSAFRWVSEERAREAAAERAEILEALSGRVRIGFKGTKVDCNGLSPGCTLCGEGAWSCLFINQICNARCFYCPSEQTHRAEPSTNGILLQTPGEYVRYLRQFRFRGASISGGEPFLTFERSLKYLAEIRKGLGEQIYLWLYTNGIAVTREKLVLFKEAGLDEIRFDISANHYELSKVAMAMEEIGRVTVEIPALPEDFERMKYVMRELRTLGVKHLNLHHLRCTPHNRENLVKRGYTFLHGPKVTVLDSELTALRLLRYAKEAAMDLPINYCSYVYKNRFQTVGQRLRLVPYVCNPYEDITAAGAIRRMYIKENQEKIAALGERLEKEGWENATWYIPKSRDRLFFKESLWPLLSPSEHTLFLDYFIPVLNSGPSYHFIFKEVPLSRKKAVFVEKVSGPHGKKLEGASLDIFARHFLRGERNQEDSTYSENLGPLSGGDLPRLTPELEEIGEFEEIGFGLQDYY